jgi:hypothetical protein
LAIGRLPTRTVRYVSERAARGSLSALFGRGLDDWFYEPLVEPDLQRFRTSVSADVNVRVSRKPIVSNLCNQLASGYAITNVHPRLIEVHNHEHNTVGSFQLYDRRLFLTHQPRTVDRRIDV